MELAKIQVNDFGGAPVCEHNMPCAICQTKPAVYNLSVGYFEPCRECQWKGWRTGMRRLSLWWFRNFLKRS